MHITVMYSQPTMEAYTHRVCMLVELYSSLSVQSDLLD